jgi:hypothetical protein
MPFIHGKDAAIVHGATALTSFLNDGSVSQDIETAETTVFGSAGGAKTYIVGLRDATLSASGLFDGAANAVDDVLQASIGSDTLAPVLFAQSGITAGNRCYIMQAKTTSYEVSAPVGDVVSVSYDAQADGGTDDAILLTALAAVTATGNGSSQDNTTSTANGGVAQLHVTANSMNNNTIFKVQHSADNSTWADLATFTTVATTVTTSERVTVATGTTVNRYLRANYTASGTGSITFTMAFARR